MSAGMRKPVVPRARQFVAALALLFFCLPNYVLATHVHLDGIAASHANPAAHSPASWQKSAKPGPFDDPATCPFCQDMALVGHYTTPIAPLLLAPLALLIAKALQPTATAHVERPHHGWYGRAPPRA